MFEFIINARTNYTWGKLIELGRTNGCMIVGMWNGWVRENRAFGIKKKKSRRRQSLSTTQPSSHSIPQRWSAPSEDWLISFNSTSMTVRRPEWWQWSRQAWGWPSPPYPTSNVSSRHCLVRRHVYTSFSRRIAYYATSASWASSSPAVSKSVCTPTVAVLIVGRYDVVKTPSWVARIKSQTSFNFPQIPLLSIWQQT